MANVGLLSAGATATWVESRREELVLSRVAARARDQAQLGILATVRRADFELPYPPDKQASLEISTLDGSEGSDLRLTYGRGLEALCPVHAGRRNGGRVRA